MFRVRVRSYKNEIDKTTSGSADGIRSEFFRAGQKMNVQFCYSTKIPFIRRRKKSISIGNIYVVSSVHHFRNG